MRLQLDNDPVADTPLRYTECGLDDVWLTSGFTVEVDPLYGTLITIRQEDDLCRAIGLRLVEQALAGPEARFLRRLIGPTLFWQVEQDP
jgi:hypothetical protein